MATAVDERFMAAARGSERPGRQVVMNHQVRMRLSTVTPTSVRIQFAVSERTTSQAALYEAIRGKMKPKTASSTTIASTCVNRWRRRRRR